jgi:hypothetical protein
LLFLGASPQPPPLPGSASPSFGQNAVSHEAEQTLLLLEKKNMNGSIVSWGKFLSPQGRPSRVLGKTCLLRSRTNAFASFLEKKSAPISIVSWKGKLPNSLGRHSQGLSKRAVFCEAELTLLLFWNSALLDQLFLGENTSYAFCINLILRNDRTLALVLYTYLKK